MKKIGVLGASGRIGGLLVDILSAGATTDFVQGEHLYGRDNIVDDTNLERFLRNNDVIIDFSHKDATEKMLRIAAISALMREYEDVQKEEYAQNESCDEEGAVLSRDVIDEEISCFAQLFQQNMMQRSRYFDHLCAMLKIYEAGGDDFSWRESFERSGKKYCAERVMLLKKRGNVKNEILQSGGSLSENKIFIIGTTGWDTKKMQDEISKISAKSVVVIAPNTSIGTMMQVKLAAWISDFLLAYGIEHDVDIIDRHHRNKVDPISGTANKLRDAVMASYAEHSITADYGSVREGPRLKNYIAINSIRSGDTVGEHNVEFMMRDEAIEVKHRVFNRNVFAEGALAIAAKVLRKDIKAGLYDVGQVLEL